MGDTFSWTLCDSEKQMGWVCVLNLSRMSCTLKWAGSQGSLDKKRLSSCLCEHGSNCIAQMGTLNTARQLSDGCAVKVQSGIASQWITSIARTLNVSVPSQSFYLNNADLFHGAPKLYVFRPLAWDRTCKSLYLCLY